MQHRDPDPHAEQAPGGHRWTFLSNHAHVLVVLQNNPDARLRDLASAIGITERAVLNILADLEGAGFLERSREGRRNHYTLHLELPLRHPLEAHCEVAQLVDLVRSAGRGGSR